MKNIIILLIATLIGNVALAQNLHSNGSQEKKETPSNKNLTIVSGDTEVTGVTHSKSESSGCLETITNLVVEGDESVANGENKTFVACSSIVFSAGFTATEGSTVHAYTSSDYCPDPPVAPGAAGIPTSIHLQSALGNHDFGIYPNPTKGKINVDFLNNSYENADLFIVDSKGQRIKEMKTENKAKIDIDLSHLSNGTYFVVVRDADKVITKKFVKK